MLTVIGTAVTICLAVIAYFQWRTAQQKVALDILNTRYEIYKDLRAAVTSFLSSPQLAWPPEDQSRFDTAHSRARFHFGTEVDLYLADLRRDMVVGHLFERYAPRPNPTIDNHLARIERINNFYKEIDRMVVPYMRIDQRMPLWWWTGFSSACKRTIWKLWTRLSLLGRNISHSKEPPT